MAKEIRVPALGESVTEATIAKWFKNAGDAVKADEPLVANDLPRIRALLTIRARSIIRHARTLSTACRPR